MMIILTIIASLIALFFVVAALGRKQLEKTEKTLYPYVIPETYLEHPPADPHGIVRPLGHGLLVSLVFDLGGVVQSVSAEDLIRLNLTAESAHLRALQNLELLAQANLIKMAGFPNGPSGQPFVLVGGHWAAATALLLPGLKSRVEETLGSKEVLASIPHREALLLFPMGDRAHRDALRTLVQDKESDGRKPLTFELFTLGEEGILPFVEQT